MSDLLQHPDADQLNAFVEHTLPAHERQQTLAHLAECAACREVVALSLPPMAHPEVMRAPWFAGRRLAWAGVPALAALIVVGIFLRTERVPKSAPAPVDMARAVVAPPAAAPAPAPALRQQTPQAKRLQRATPPAVSALGNGVGGGVMGGIMSATAGGSAGATPQASSAATVAVGSPAFALAGRSAQAVIAVPVALPSHLPALSTASQGSRRVAIDNNHQLFFSEDAGQNWKVVPAQWQGHAMRVAVAGAGSASLTVNGLTRATGSASISGTVTDTSGAVIGGTAVSATDTNGNIVQVVTDQQGRFRMEHLAPGGYRIEAEKEGFEQQALSAEIAASQQAVVNLTLQVAAAAQTVMVQSAAPAVEPTGPGFALITEDGSRWVSADGLHWRPE